jgi:hypothetical protein
MCLTFMLVAGFSFPPPSEEALSPFASLLLLVLLLSFPPALALAFGAIVRAWRGVGKLVDVVVGWWGGRGGSRWLVSPTSVNSGLSDLFFVEDYFDLTMC